MKANVSSAVTPAFLKGFTTLAREGDLGMLPVTGRVPEWLSGTLVRNGPAKFEIGTQRYRHWFDGLGMLHRFTFDHGTVSYANRFLRSNDYVESTAHGVMAAGGFATTPHRSLFTRLLHLLSPRLTDNACVNIVRMAGRYVALTETPLPIEFNPRSLETIGPLVFSDTAVRGPLTTAHPQVDCATGALVNVVIQLSRISRYVVYELPAGSSCRRVIGSVPVREPAYLHTFGMTAQHVIIAEVPLVLNIWHLLFSGKPLIENYFWKPERGTRFIVMNRQNGAVRSYSTNAFFAYHHINAFEQHGDLMIDIVAYPDVHPIASGYLDQLEAGAPLLAGEFRRYRLPANGTHASYERTGTETFDLPRINYPRCAGKDYQFAYGISNRRDRPFDAPNQLVKVDVRQRTEAVWFDDACYPGEPVFVPAPGANGAAAEDDGVILSVVLDARAGTSFLLVLDAASWCELARAVVPHHIPFGFHGEFFPH